MNIEITPKSAVELLNQADKLDTPYHFARVNTAATRDGEQTTIALVPDHDASFPLPQITLHQDGTYRVHVELHP